MLEFDQFEEVVQIRMGREGGGDMPWGNPGEALYWTAAYLVDGLLVDTGCSYTADELADFLEGKALTLAVNTHYHEDHIGANHVLRERFGIPIFASPQSVPLIRQVPGIHLYQEVVWGYPVPTEVEPVPDTIRTERFSFDVVPTPGHSKDHICLVEPTKGWCFSGDLFVSTEPRSVRPEEDIGETVRSMQKLIALGTDRLVLFSALGTVVEDGHEALRSCIRYLRDLCRKSKQLEAQGLSAGEIRDEIFGRETVLAGLSEGDISSENMIRAALRANI